MFTGLHVLSLALAATSEEPIENRNSLLVANAAWAVVHFASAFTGYHWASDCQQAYDDWNGVDPKNLEEQRRLALLDVAGHPQNDPRTARAFWCSASTGDCVVTRAACEGHCSRQETAWCARDENGYVCRMGRDGCLAAHYSKQSRNLGECVERRAELAHLAEPVRATPPAAGPNPSATPSPVSAPPVPRGYYCSSSAATPGAGFCTREEVDCQRARDVALAAVTDLSECRIVEAAFCHVADGNERCAPAMEACAERAKSATGVTTTCEERK
ncbi:MAG TPA: hypothetical protein VNO30_00350 [Kofleriaceae bacterium]|nr:hypothetical protein [Kofleriaceae bacterium]